MTYTDIALLIAAVSQLVAAIATLLATLRNAP